MGFRASCVRRLAVRVLECLRFGFGIGGPISQSSVGRVFRPGGYRVFRPGGSAALEPLCRSWPLLGPEAPQRFHSRVNPRLLALAGLAIAVDPTGRAQALAI